MTADKITSLGGNAVIKGGSGTKSAGAEIKVKQQRRLLIFQNQEI